MDTLNPSCAFVSSLSPDQAEQILSRLSDQPAMEAAAPVITGDPLPSGMIPPETVPEYPVYVVGVPASFNPDSWHTAPPGANHYPSGEVAAEVVATLNRAKIKASPDGSVTSWFIRLRKSTGGASISVNLSQPWKPRDEYDMPPAFMTMRGQVMQWRGIIADLNERFRRAAVGKNVMQRAYVAHSIRPEELRPIPTGDQTSRESPKGQNDPSGKTGEKPLVSPIAQNEPSGDSAPKRSQPGSVYLIDVPRDYSPFSQKSLPGSFQKVKDKELAQVATVRANQRLLERSTHGIVYAWYLTVDASGCYGIVQLNVPSGWVPAGPYDMPEPMTVIPGKKKRKQFLKELNRQLDKDNTRGRKRAYVAIPIERPEAREMQPQSQPEPQKQPAERKPLPPFPGPDWEKFIPEQSGSVLDADLMQRGQFQTDTSQQDGNGSSRSSMTNRLQAIRRLPR